MLINERSLTLIDPVSVVLKIVFFDCILNLQNSKSGIDIMSFTREAKEIRIEKGVERVVWNSSYYENYYCIYCTLHIGPVIDIVALHVTFGSLLGKFKENRKRNRNRI